MIRAGRNAGREYAVLETKLDVEKTLLLQWAHRVQLLETEYDRRLYGEVVSKLVITVNPGPDLVTALRERLSVS